MGSFVDDETRKMIFDLLKTLSNEQSMRFMDIFFRLLVAYENKPCYIFPPVKESPAVPYVMDGGDSTS